MYVTRISIELYMTKKTTWILIIVTAVLAIILIILVATQRKQAEPMLEPGAQTPGNTQAQQSQTKTPTPANLDGLTYKLTAFNETRFSEDQEYLLTFDDGGLRTKLCNNMSGAYNLEGNTITAGLNSTMMYCADPANLMTIETAFGTALQDGAVISIRSNTLTLKGDAGDTFTYTLQKE